MRYLVFLMLIALPSAVASQENLPGQPLITLDVPEQDVIVGQPAIVRLKVLVPTFMPSPPVFPSLEQENLLVRLPERASGPISETVNGETWSGVQRSYRLYPLSAGQIAFDAQDVGVTFADPETNDAVQVKVPLPPITLNAVVPDGARGLDPMIIATGFDLKQEVEGDTEMQSGGAITRRLTTTISGTTPILIPALIPDTQDPLLRSYPKEPQFTETEDRSILSGQRVDETTYLARAGGQTQLPPITVQWYNLETDQIETIDLAAIELHLAAPKRGRPSVETITKSVALVALVTLAIWAALRWGMPRIRNWNDARKRIYNASPEFAVEQLRRALRNADLSGAYSSLELWKTRSGDSKHAAQLEAQLAQIGATRYRSKGTGTTADWSAALLALDTLVKTPRDVKNPLPPLNP